MIYGVGVDILEIERIEGLIERHSERFLCRVFTPVEREYCSRFSDAHRHLAVRFAAKEAVMKALGTGFAKGIRWMDIEVYNLDSGKPEVRLKGKAKEIADSLGITRIHISLSHSVRMALATAIAEKDGERSD